MNSVFQRVVGIGDRMIADGGLTKHEFFAAFALAGLLANPRVTCGFNEDEAHPESQPIGGSSRDVLIEEAWLIADAMVDMRPASAGEQPAPVDGVTVPSFGRGL